MALTAEEMKKAELEKMRQQFAGSDARSEFLKDREQKRTNAWHDANRQARIDRLEGMIGAGAGRYSPIQIKQTQDQLDYLRGGGVAGLREHEKRMADTAGEWAVKKEAEHAKGLIGQGSDAARFNAEAKNNETRSRYGFFDEKDVYHPGSDVSVAEKTGLTRAEELMLKNEGAANVANIRNRGNVDVAQIRRQGSENVATTRAGATVDAAKAHVDAIEKRRGEVDAAREQRDFEKFDKDINNIMDTRFTQKQRDEWNALTPEEKKAKWLEKTGRKQPTPAQTSPESPKEGDRKMFKQGPAVWKNGKWVIESR